MTGNGRERLLGAWITVGAVPAGKAIYLDFDSAPSVDIKQMLMTIYFTLNLITELNVAGVLTGLTAGDYVAIDFQSDTANIRVVGLEFDYN